ncbi:hypothetical protein ACFO1B_17945 [Dactylosporangium siamense]|uniref:DUF4386 family protein n=1 Tax=Dactylosporangium siamense TaxID=685454 RepID=A0A919PP29_9ACTN|nr:hypothetical protein [Dactylosporangium siamense]GIG45728.1 hypothetical protein Dsi01nite_037690 [Dactylosporangium siamense]
MRDPKATGRLLVLALAPFLAWFVLAMATLAQTGVDNSADFTPGVLADVRLQWVAIAVLYALAVLTGAAGMAMVATSPGLTVATRIASGVSAVAIIGNLVLALSMSGSTTAKLSDNSLWSPSLWLSMISIWAALAAIVLTGVGLRRTGVLRRTGLVVAIIAGLILLADLALGGAFPPLLVGFLWLAIGIGLLRRPVTATVQPVASTA